MQGEAGGKLQTDDSVPNRKKEHQVYQLGKNLQLMGQAHYHMNQQMVQRILVIFNAVGQ